jgi:hypothetical protein
VKFAHSGVDEASLATGASRTHLSLLKRETTMLEPFIEFNPRALPAIAQKAALALSALLVVLFVGQALLA